MIVTIDGPAGAGKSTAAKTLAQRLGFEFLDTGAMYRAVAWAGRQAGIDLTNEAQLEAFLTALSLEVLPGRVLVAGADVTGVIRTPEITALSKPVADSPAVRRFLNQIQRRFGVGRSIVTEGRDQGTIVFPEAECKIFLVAQPEERALRRYRQLVANGQKVTFEEVLAAQNDRDARDAARAIAPMIPAPDAMLLDTTGLTTEQVIDRLEQLARSRMPGGERHG